MKKWSIRRRNNVSAEYYAGDLMVYTNVWTTSLALASAFRDDRDASGLVEYMENGWRYSLVEAI